MKEQNQLSTQTKYVNLQEQQRQSIYQTNRFDNSYARAQYKRNLDALRMRYMDNLYMRKERLINLQKQEEHSLMKEFEEMKRQEQLDEFEHQEEFICQFKMESKQIHDDTVKRAEQQRINSTNAVQMERMSLENVKTAN